MRDIMSRIDLHSCTLPLSLASTVFPDNHHVAFPVSAKMRVLRVASLGFLRDVRAKRAYTPRAILRGKATAALKIRADDSRAAPCGCCSRRAGTTRGFDHGKVVGMIRDATSHVIEIHTELEE